MYAYAIVGTSSRQLEVGAVELASLLVITGTTEYRPVEKYRWAEIYKEIHPVRIKVQHKREKIEGFVYSGKEMK